METKFVSDLSRIHRIRQILLVGEDEEEGVAQLVLVQHTVQLLTRLGHTLAFVRVDDEDDALRVLEVCVAGDRVRCGAGGDTSETLRAEETTHNTSRGDESCPVLRRPRR